MKTITDEIKNNRIYEEIKYNIITLWREGKNLIIITYGLSLLTIFFIFLGKYFGSCLSSNTLSFLYDLTFLCIGCYTLILIMFILFENHN